VRLNIYETDVLVIGGGLAAARAAIEAASEGAKVAVVAKAPIGKSGASTMAGGGLAAAIDIERDSPAVHYEDTVAAGRGLTDLELAKILAHEVPARVKDLIDYGVQLEREAGKISLRPTPGHSNPRQIHSIGGGVGYLLPLRRKALSYPNVSLHEDVMAFKLLEADNRVAGAICYDIKTGELDAFKAGATILATGGYQELYPLSSASVDMTGDGYALAFEAGAELVDMEMLLYYPTALLSPPSVRGALLLYEFALHERGLGARLVNARGEDLLETYNPLPVRDVLSRRIFQEIREGKGTANGGVYIDMCLSPRSPDDRARLLLKRDPFSSFLTSVGLDVANSKLEIAPAAHTVLGGVRIDAHCRTTLPGLFAAGEVAGNVHGANRLGGNALSETQVFGQRAGLFAARYARESTGRAELRISDEQIEDAAQPVLVATRPKAAPLRPAEVKQHIRQTMFECAGPAKDEKGLLEGIRRMGEIIDSELPRVHVDASPAEFNYALQEALEARTMAYVAQVVCQAALVRRESRGHHYRIDYPRPDDSQPPYRTRAKLQDRNLVVDTFSVSQNGEFGR